MRRSAAATSLFLAVITVGTFSRPCHAILIVALGDSTTAGTPFFKSPVESPPNGEGDPEGQYAYWMMHRHKDWTVTNLGIDGQRTDEIRARFDDAIKSGPRYIIILGGVNDVYQGSSLQAAADNLNWMYGQALDHNVVPIAATVLPFDRATAQQSEDIKKLNDFIRHAADRRHIPLAELHDAVADPSDPNRLNGSPDGLHPDIGGYRTMGLALTKIVEEMEKARSR